MSSQTELVQNVEKSRKFFVSLKHNLANPFVVHILCHHHPIPNLYKMIKLFRPTNLKIRLLWGLTIKSFHFLFLPSTW